MSIRRGPFCVRVGDMLVRGCPPPPHSARGPARFGAAVRAPAGRARAGPRFGPANLRQAFIWREILGPPKALE